MKISVDIVCQWIYNNDRFKHTGEKMQDYQFYPTPHSLAEKAWGLFKDREISRVLDPSAGDGDLLHAYGKFDRYSSMNRQIGVVDAIEIDASHHANLEAKGIRVVGFDFICLP